MAFLRIVFSLETTDLSDRANGIGTAELSIEVDGYSARATGYAQEVALVEFATELAAYPLPAAATSLSLGDCRVDIAPIDAMGHLRLTGHLSDRHQTATLSFSAEYASLERFRTAIALVSEAGRCDATLVGEEL